MTKRYPSEHSAASLRFYFFFDTRSTRFFNIMKHNFPLMELALLLSSSVIWIYHHVGSDDALYLNVNKHFVRLRDTMNVTEELITHERK